MKKKQNLFITKSFLVQFPQSNLTSTTLSASRKDINNNPENVNIEKSDSDNLSKILKQLEEHKKLINTLMRDKSNLNSTNNNKTTKKSFLEIINEIKLTNTDLILILSFLVSIGFIANYYLDLDALGKAFYTFLSFHKFI